MLYEAWLDDTDSTITISTPEGIERQRRHGQLGTSARLLHTITVDTWEEAMAVHNVKMGYEPYDPGTSSPCPNGCGSVVYMDGSGQCQRCSNATSVSPTRTEKARDEA